MIAPSSARSITAVSRSTRTALRARASRGCASAAATTSRAAAASSGGRRGCGPGCAKHRRSPLRRRRAVPKPASHAPGCRTACRGAAHGASPRWSRRRRRAALRRRRRCRCLRFLRFLLLRDGPHDERRHAAVRERRIVIAPPRGVLLDALLRDDALVVDWRGSSAAAGRRRLPCRARARSDPRTRRCACRRRACADPGRTDDPVLRVALCGRSSTVSSPNSGQPGAAFAPRRSDG